MSSRKLIDIQDIFGDFIFFKNNAYIGYENKQRFEIDNMYHLFLILCYFSIV